MAAVLAWSAPGLADSQDNVFSFNTTAEFMAKCDVDAPSHECRFAVQYVEQVVDGGDKPNDTCDGGPDSMIQSRDNAEFDAWLNERLTKIMPWLRQHPEYNSMSYGDGIWAALKGVYCGSGQ